MMFEYRMLRRIFGPKRKDVTRVWKKLLQHIQIVCTEGEKPILNAFN
jgi:hypothetical protein